MRPFWLHQALEAMPEPPAPPLDRELRVDVCIVGGGYTGLWTALELRRQAPGLRVALIKAAIAPLAATGLADGVSVLDSCTFVHYYRTTPAGRLMLGKGGNTFAFGGHVHDLFDRPSRYRAQLSRSLEAFFPSLAGVPLAASWTGPSDRSVIGLPF